jgi:hypothetical protein
VGAPARDRFFGIVLKMMWKNLWMLWRTLKEQGVKDGDLGSGTAAKNERKVAEHLSGRATPVYAWGAGDLLS